jgi:type IV secretion system protein VirD4
VGTVIGFVILIALGVLAYKFLLKPFLRALGRSGRNSLEGWPRQETDADAQWLAQLGPSHQQRVPVIEAMFEDRTTTLSSTYCVSWKRWKEDREMSDADRQRKRRPEVDASVLLTVSRNLAGLDNRERTYLRAAELLNSAANGSLRQARQWRTALIFGDGKASVPSYKYQGLPLSDCNEAGAVAAAAKNGHLSVDETINYMQEYASQVLSSPNGDPYQRTILGELTEAIAPGGGGSWLKASQIESSPYSKQSDYALSIGSLPDGTPLTYSGEGSLVTIAPPGSGKTQCNVFPNLLTWTGPAVVLDISGDIFEHTAAWREQNVGPVYKFSPLEPEDSHKYNPLTFVRRDPDFIWEDSRLLAEMMIVPSLSSDPFWENEARTVLTSAIAYVCYTKPPEERPMHAVIDCLFGGPAWDEMIIGLGTTIDVRAMQQHATALATMNEKTLSSVQQTARSSLSAWAGERVARATAKSDWSPLDLRSGTNPTIYIYIRPNEVDAYLSLLRVFIGQHIRVLTGGSVPPRDAPPILVMLDELPRLRYMAPIDESLSIGRKYGLRLWMFAQSVGQFQTAYQNADGMLGSCAVRVFMNPGGADGLAERLSGELGYVDSANDNSRRRLVEAAELSGPAYQDQQIVFAGGAKPAKVTKDFAYTDAELTRRMSIPPLGDRDVDREPGSRSGAPSSSL